MKSYYLFGILAAVILLISACSEPRQQVSFQDELFTMKAVIGDIRKAYRNNIKRDSKNTKVYEEALIKLHMKETLLQQLEKDFIENKKSIHELQKELEDIRNIKTLDESKIKRKKK